MNSTVILLPNSFESISSSNLYAEIKVLSGVIQAFLFLHLIFYHLNKSLLILYLYNLHYLDK
ncbi:hypothetical protein ACN2C3_01765 [Aliarcobacter butzleri]